MPFNILFPDSRSDPLDIEREVAGPDTTLVNARKDRFEAVELSAWQNCDAIITRFVPIDAKVIPHLKRTRIVVRNGVGFDVVDLKACGEAGIVVCNVPDYGTTEVADHAIALMLGLARGLVSYHARLLAGQSADVCSDLLKEFRAIVFSLEDHVAALNARLSAYASGTSEGVTQPRHLHARMPCDVDGAEESDVASHVRFARGCALRYTSSNCAAFTCV